MSEIQKKWTVADLLKMLPNDWSGAEIAVGTRVSPALRVKRISLVHNRGGRRVVVIHSTEIAPTEADA